MTPNDQNELAYELQVSPRSSVYSLDLKPSSTPTPPTPPTPTPTPPPTIRLLCSLIPRRYLLSLVLPAILSSLVAGGIAPFMTYVIGQAFNAFAQFPLTPNPPEHAKRQLLHDVGIAALELVGLAVGSLALSSLTSCLWIWTGEINVMALRKRVYAAVTQKDMVWFDTKMGAEAGDEQGPLGAGGLMAKFTRETDDVRMASSLASGMLIQYLTTCLTCLVLAFLRSWALTLVILSTVPLLVLIQALSQRLAAPLLAHERTHTATAAALVDRAAAAIPTVKAFNAQPFEHAALAAVLARLTHTATRLAAVWGATSGLAQFVMMSMFVQGFWFGAKLVRDGAIAPGDVMAVFWACLIATSNLQMCIPQFITLAKGKFAIASLLALVGDHVDDAPSTYHPITTSTRPPAYTRRPKPRRPTHLRKILPTRCTGELALHNVTFAYPTRPAHPALHDVSLFLPAHETTFIVGGSGSGKSTVGALLLRLYAPQTGAVLLDEQDVRFLDAAWVQAHVAGVEQGSAAGSASGGASAGSGGATLVPGSVWENVAVGLAGEGREPAEGEVEEACRAALVHEFVRDLPEGYETRLGEGGRGLSGGQRQRLAIARARLRNPTVLILDEATSALDPPSRLLVFAAIRRWRAGKTTVVITHELAQVGAGDFAYVLRGGRVVEQGFRADLEAARGEFWRMVQVQGGDDESSGERGDGDEKEGVLPGYESDGEAATERVHALLEEEEEERERERERAAELDVFDLRHQSFARPGPLRPITLGNWMLDVVADLTGVKGGVEAPAPETTLSQALVEAEAENTTAQRKRRPSSISITVPAPPERAHTVLSRRYSLQFTPASPTFPGYEMHAHPHAHTRDEREEAEAEAEEAAFEREKGWVQRSGVVAGGDRRGRRRPEGGRRRAVEVVVHNNNSDSNNNNNSNDNNDSGAYARPAFWATARTAYASVPHKPILLLGLALCLLSGAMTPVFSYLLSTLLFQVSAGARDAGAINRAGGVVLAVAAVDGLLLGLKYVVMEGAGARWVERVRGAAYGRVLAQDQGWFEGVRGGAGAGDDASASAEGGAGAGAGAGGGRLVQVLVKDGEDARDLVAVVAAQGCVVAAMLGVGLVWALVRGWQLTLVGVAVAPVFAGAMAVQTALVAGCEVRNKRAREEVAKGYYDAISNIRGIRAMALERVFRRQFDAAADRALTTGVRGAFVEGCTYGVASGLIYLAEALLFYVGAVLIAKGTYTYLQMVQVLNLVVFTVTIGSQLMAFTQKIAKSVQATNDLQQLLTLPTDTHESQGTLKPELHGAIRFEHVAFAYPTRPDEPVLKDVSFTVAPGEVVAVVGASGSGKSTVAALLQRLYEPAAGRITIGGAELRTTDVRHLREHVAVVSQHASLFDASVEENIRYGDAAVSAADVRRAAKAAMVHEFVMGLPMGYDTPVGENAGLISGGQGQRLQIARALARRGGRVLVLDECTSALDADNQAAVVREIVGGERGGRTVVMVTHKVEVMRMCDRVLVLEGGVVVEEGRYEELVERKGVFAALASGGEWVGE